MSTLPMKTANLDFWKPRIDLSKVGCTQFWLNVVLLIITLCQI